VEFFDPKEDVMDIQITQYGKYLLSKGLFKPVFYSFHDHDILYDDAYVGGGNPQEAQNQSQLRITGSTPRPKTHSVFSGIETEIKRINRLIRYGEVLDENGKVATLDKEQIGSQKIQPSPTRAFAFTSPIGTGGTRTEYAPSWSLKFIKGELSSSSPYLSSSLSKHQILHIPQITSSLVYETFEVSDEDFAAFDNAAAQEPEELGFSPSLSDTNYSILDDGTPVFTRENSILIEIQEENVDLTNENFDIEVFAVEKDIASGQEMMTPLYFSKKPNNVVNGILLDDDEIKKKKPDHDESYVQYYFDVNVDCEINFSKINKDVEKSRRVYLSGLPCLPSRPMQGQADDMYGPTKEESLEDCD